MTSRKSSGSMRAESAVEPTRSENITVTWRRSAASWDAGSAAVAHGRRRGRAKFADRAQQLPAITEDDAEVFQVLIGQVGKD